MNRGVSSGGGQSSLNYLFGRGEAPNPTLKATQSAPAANNIPSAKVDDQLKTSELQPIQTDPDNNNYDPDETITELNSAQDETTTVEVDDTKIISDNNNSLVVEDHDEEEVEEIAETVSAQESNVSKSPCKNIVEDDLVKVFLTVW